MRPWSTETAKEPHDLLKPRRPTRIESKLGPLYPVSAEALDLPIRKDLLPREQLAFDKWAASQRAAGVDVKRALQGRSADQVCRLIRDSSTGWPSRR
jgi:hypothetical protein